MEQGKAVRERGRPAKIHLVKQRLRHDIIQGKLAVNEQLAGYRDLAYSLGVSALTAKRAIDELVVEGWLSSRHGVGTFVCERRHSSQVVLTAPRRGGKETFFSAHTLDRFHESHPHVRILLSSEPDTDILFTDSYSLVVDRFRQRNLQSLDALCDRFGRRSWKLPPRLRAMASSGNDLFGLPLRLDLQALQINPQLLALAGIETPQHYLDWKTFELILRRCHSDRDGDGLVECYGTYSRLWLHEWLVPFWQRGGRLDDEAAFFEKKALSVLDDLCRWYHVERTLPIEPLLGENEMVSDFGRERFETGKIALRWINGKEFFQAFPFHAPILLPRFGPVPKQMAHAVMLGIHKDCRHPEVALQFLDFCYDSYICDNKAYPFALLEEDRRFLSEEPGLSALLQEAVEHACEPLHEGVPQRTWSIEKQIYRWYRLLQDRATTMTRVEEFWRRDWSGEAKLPRHAFFGSGNDDANAGDSMERRYR